MKRQFKRAVALACALLFIATIFAGIPGYTAKANEWSVTKIDRVVYEGEILKTPRAVYYVKQGMSESFYETNDFSLSWVSEAAIGYLLHGNEDRDVYFSYKPTLDLEDYRVPAPEEATVGLLPCG